MPTVYDLMELMKRYKSEVKVKKLLSSYTIAKRSTEQRNRASPTIVLSIFCILNIFGDKSMLYITDLEIWVKNENLKKTFGKKLVKAICHNQVNCKVDHEYYTL